MAKVKRYVGDHVSGKMGNVVFYQFRGKTYARMAPNRTKDSWKPRQETHRQRFKQAVSLWRHAKEANISVIWNLGSEEMNGYALFLKANMPALALNGTLMDPRMLQLSTGKLNLPQEFKAVRAEGETLAMQVSWKNDPLLSGERLKDQLMVITTNGNKYMERMATGIKRGDAGGTFELPAKPSHHMADFTHVYLFFASRDEKDFTASCCFEIAAPLS